MVARARPAASCAAGERVVLADLDGPGRSPTSGSRSANAPLSSPPPGFLRAQVLEVFYDVPRSHRSACRRLDYFGVVHGVHVVVRVALTAVNDGLGLDAASPCPSPAASASSTSTAPTSSRSSTTRRTLLLGPIPDDTAVLHVDVPAREPDHRGPRLRDPEGLRGPGRYLGMHRRGAPATDRHWWGEGEVKVFLDGEDHPDDLRHRYRGLSRLRVGSREHSRRPSPARRSSLGARRRRTDGWAPLVGFYRWHLTDPVVFTDVACSGHGATDRHRHLRRRRGQRVRSLSSERHRRGRRLDRPWVRRRSALAFGLYERGDDWCAASFVYCADAHRCRTSTCVSRAPTCRAREPVPDQTDDRRAPHRVHAAEGARPAAPGPDHAGTAVLPRGDLRLHRRDPRSGPTSLSTSTSTSTRSYSTSACSTATGRRRVSVRYGSTIHAFEPGPAALAKLMARLARSPQRRPARVRARRSRPAGNAHPCRAGLVDLRRRRGRRPARDHHRHHPRRRRACSTSSDST